MHKGFMVVGMTGNMSAEIVETGEYVEVIITDSAAVRSFDLNGLESFSDDIDQLRQLATQVDRCNQHSREVVE
jgi:hypothetical protein